MNLRGQGFGRVVAIIEAACAVLLLVGLITLGVVAEREGSGGRSLIDRATPFVAGLLLGGWCGLRALRSWRTVVAPGVSSQGEVTVDALISPELSEGGQTEVARVVDLLLKAGVFAPEAPLPDRLHAGVAGFGEPVTADVVLSAMLEADYYHPEFVLARHAENLAFHDSHAEQDLDSLRSQAADLLRLCHADPTKHTVNVLLRHDQSSGLPVVSVQILSGRVERSCEYVGDHKQLSIQLHRLLASALGHESCPRLAWLWCDQGVWLSGLKVASIEQLNADLGAAAGEGWAWVDEADD